jgi:hypothetical protein
VRLLRHGIRPGEASAAAGGVVAVAASWRFIIAASMGFGRSARWICPNVYLGFV